MSSALHKGMVKTDNFCNNQNKLVYANLLTPQGIAEKADAQIQTLDQFILRFTKLQDAMGGHL